MKRSKFNLSHYKLLSCNQGQLVPIACTEVLPGDSIQHATSLLIRTQPLNTPVMHPVHVRVHHWYVPNRLVWANWEKFITGGDTPDSPPTFPTIAMSSPAIGSLADYLGVPVRSGTFNVSALPFRAYAKIYNEFYRDQDLTTALTINTGDGGDSTTSITLQNVAWEKDYYTTARPWAQKGAAVTLPLGSSATVKTTASELVSGAQAALHFKTTAGNWPVAGVAGFQGGSQGDLQKTGTAGGSLTETLYPTNLYADLSGATAATVNDIRLAMALQRYAEARARYGSRYTEYLRFLGIKSSDARLQRPEYLGGGKQTIQFSEVVQTAPADQEATLGVGNLAGHGIGATRTNRYRRFFEEHGYVISLLSVQPRTMYYQGLERHWNRRTRTDFWQRELQHIGQQEIKKKEIYLQATSADDETWAYQDRYDEYRRAESKVAGDFRNSLNTWHMGREFSSLPVINDAFIKSNPTTRIYQAPVSPQLQVMAYHSMQARRLVAQIGTSHIY